MWLASSRDRNNTTNPAPWTASRPSRLSIYQLPGSNALETAAGVYAKMKDLKTRFPEGVDYKIVYDTTPFIRESVNEVFYTLARRGPPGGDRRPLCFSRTGRQ